MANYIETAIAHKGFSLVEVISTCPTYYGRKNKKGSPVNMLTWLKEHYVDTKAAQKMTPEQLDGKFLMGEFKNILAPEYTEEYGKIIRQCLPDYSYEGAIENND